MTFGDPLTPTSDLTPGEDDDCVKLYDLSSLLENRFEGVGRDDNPFSGHVALLLYR